MYARQGTNAYAQVSLQSEVSGASPHQLISMLFDGAHNAILRAKIYAENGKIARRGEMISRAINIIDNGLRAALDHDKGLDIAADLDRLYDYMSRTLLEANIRNEPQLLLQVDKLLMRIATTWKEIGSDYKQANDG